MKSELVMMEFQDLETHLNRTKDFAGSRVRMSKTTSSEGRSDNNSFGLDIIGLRMFFFCSSLCLCLRSSEEGKVKGKVYPLVN